MSAPQGGPLSSPPNIGGAFGGGPVKPQPAAPLTDEQLRLECVKQAISAGVDTRFVTESADRFAQYVKTGTPSDGSTLSKGKGA